MKTFILRCAITVVMAALFPLGWVIIGHQSSAAFETAVILWVAAFSGIVWVWRLP